MKITREKACQRLHHRVSTPLNVLINGREYSAADWSLGGLRVTDWDDWQETESLVGQRFECKFELPFQGFNIAFEVLTEVVRCSKENAELGLKFIDLDERQIELLNHFVEQLVRGAMTPVEDTILRIDSPVTPVSTKPDPSPAHEVPVNRLPLRLIGMSSLYFLVGSALLFLMAVTIYENFLNLKVDTAVTVKPQEPLISLVDGRIKTVSATLNSPIKTGDSLLILESPDVVKRIQDAKIFIEQKQLELEAHRKRLVLAIETTGSAISKESQQHQIEIDLVQQEVALAMQKLVALYEYRDDLSVTSPGDGRLVKLLRKPGALVKRGETLAVFERNEAPRVFAYLTDEEARSIRLHSQVTVRVVNADQQWHGYIAEIRPTSKDETPSAATLALDPSRRILVKVNLPSAYRAQIADLGSGLPIEILFPVTEISRYMQTLLTDPIPVEKPLIEQQYLSSLHGEAL